VTRSFLGLGSNLGDRVGLLRDAVASLDGVVAVSPVYETEPMGGPDDQGSFLNLVVELETDLDGHELLAVCRRLEAAANRVREQRWGPRTLDVDVLWMDGVTIDDDELTIPHPRMWNRRFVMVPLIDLAPEFATEGWSSRARGEVSSIGALDELEAGA
jgi:2-amino-4-hydroxy-6-hydroxymethyldihydropteridine diphosphokinase